LLSGMHLHFAATPHDSKSVARSLAMLQLELGAAAAAAPGGGSGSGGAEGAVLGRLAAARAFLSPNFEQVGGSLAVLLPPAVQMLHVPRMPAKWEWHLVAENMCYHHGCSCFEGASRRACPLPSRNTWALQQWAPALASPLCCCRALPRRRLAASIRRRRSSSRHGARLALLVPLRAACLPSCLLDQQLQRPGSMQVPMLATQRPLCVLLPAAGCLR
jgi:hypothetical protein